MESNTIPTYPTWCLMAWRIHLTNQAIQNLHILPGKPPTLAVWTRQDRVHHYDLKTGSILAEQTLAPAPHQQPRNSDAWQEYAGQLTGPDTSFFLPHLRVNGFEMLISDDGKLRLYRLDDDSLFIEINGEEEPIRINGDKPLIALDLDRALGTIAGLDEDLNLHLYQQNIRVGTFDLGLKRDADLRPNVAVARGGGSIFVSDGRRLVAVDPGGNILRTQEMHYFIGQMAASPSGGMVVSSDMESGVIRVYRGDGLALTHQRFAIDLILAANQVQLLADLPPIGTAVSTIVASTRGVFAFSMSGVVCVTSVEQMDTVPRPKALF